MKCPNCKNKDLRSCFHSYLLWYYCDICGTFFWEVDLPSALIPDIARWRNFQDEPPPQGGNDELIFLFDSGTGEWIPDIGDYYQDSIITNGRLIDDFGDPIWWRPIGPLPEVLK